MYRAVRPPNNDFKQLRHLGQNATIEFDFYNYLESKTCKFLQICQFILTEVAGTVEHISLLFTGGSTQIHTNQSTPKPVILIFLCSR